MQAITTQFRPPSNWRDPRILTKCDAGRLTVSWDQECGVEDNHHRAATILASRLGWLDGYRLVSGCIDSGNRYAHVLVPA